MQYRSTSELRRDLELGLWVGMSIALICAFFATLRFILGGAAAFSAKTHMAIGEALLFYLLGGLSGGILIGVLRPLRGTTMGSFVIGFCAALPLSAMAALSVIERKEWYPLAAITIVMSALLAGGLGAALFGETKGWTE
jgi:hypothetical protein